MPVVINNHSVETIPFPVLNILWLMFHNQRICGCGNFIQCWTQMFCWPFESYYKEQISWFIQTLQSKLLEETMLTQKKYLLWSHDQGLWFSFSGPGCSKLMAWLVKRMLKFQRYDTQSMLLCFAEKILGTFAEQKFLTCFQQNTWALLILCILEDSTNHWLMALLLKRTMLWSTS